MSLWEDAGNIERGLPNGGFTVISAACLVAVRLDFFCPPACLPCHHQSRASERAFSGWVYTASRSRQFPTSDNDGILVCASSNRSYGT